MCRYRHKRRRRSISPNSISRSVTCWLRGFWDFPMLALSSPTNTGCWSQRRVRAYYKPGKCSRMKDRRYALMIRVRFTSVKTSQLTMFGPWKRVASTFQTCGRSWTTSHNPPCTSPTNIVIIDGHTISYLSLLRQYVWLVILVSVSMIRSKPLNCTDRMT